MVSPIGWINGSSPRLGGLGKHLETSVLGRFVSVTEAIAEQPRPRECPPVMCHWWPLYSGNVCFLPCSEPRSHVGMRDSLGGLAAENAVDPRFNVASGTLMSSTHRTASSDVGVFDAQALHRRAGAIAACWGCAATSRRISRAPMQAHSLASKCSMLGGDLRW